MGIAINNPLLLLASHEYKLASPTPLGIPSVIRVLLSAACLKVMWAARYEMFSRVAALVGSRLSLHPVELREAKANAWCKQGPKGGVTIKSSDLSQGNLRWVGGMQQKARLLGQKQVLVAKETKEWARESQLCSCWLFAGCCIGSRLASLWEGKHQGTAWLCIQSLSSAGIVNLDQKNCCQTGFE